MKGVNALGHAWDNIMSVLLDDPRLVSISHSDTRSDHPSLGSSINITLKSIQLLSSTSRDELTYLYDMQDAHE